MHCMNHASQSSACRIRSVSFANCSLGLFASLFVLAPEIACFGQQPKPHLEFVVPAPIIRTLLPEDGEIISKTLKANVWPQSAAQGPFFQDETVEFALGVGLRAKKNDRADQKAMLPSVTFQNGYMSFQGGWRAHKEVKLGLLDHPDFFDGPLNGNLVIGYAGGKSVGNAQVAIGWNPSFLSKVLFPVTAVVLPRARSAVENALEKKLGEKLPEIIDAKINSALSEKRMPEAMKEFIVADVVPEGIRIRVYDARVTLHEVQIRDVDLKPRKIGAGDSDIGGHGPKVEIEARIEQGGDGVKLSVSMHAKETKKDWTEAQGSTTQLLYQPANDEVIVAVIGPVRFSLLNNTLNGHEPHQYESPLGKLTVWGDSASDTDVGGYTRMTLSGGNKVYVVTKKQPVR